MKGEVGMASEEKRHNDGLVDKWLEDENLMLLGCWSRDGYTYQDIANRIGITTKCLKKWRDAYPEIDEALKCGREIIDYKVENALLKSALGYKTKETKITTKIVKGVIVETTKETTTKEMAPNTRSCEVWLFNRKPDKWKRNRDNLVELNEEDSTIQISVVRGSKNQENNIKENQNTEDENWIDEVNQTIEIKRTDEYFEKEKNKEKKVKTKKKQANSAKNIPTNTENEENRDLWPDDWEDE